MPTKAKAQKEFELPNKTIKVVAHVKPTAFIPDVNHAASFLAPRSKKKYVCPISSKTNRFVKVLSDEEQKHLEKLLGRSLSIYDRVDNYWENKEVILDKDNYLLNLNDPEKFIEWKILLANSLEICPKKSNLRAKLTYKYYLEDMEEQVFEQAADAALKLKAWSLFGELQKDRTKMMNFLRISNKKFGDNVSDQFLISEIMEKYIESTPDNLQYFYNTLNSPDFDLEVTIMKAISPKHNLIQKDRNKYYIQGELVAGSKAQLISFLKADKNQDTLLIIEDQIKINE